MTCERTFGPRRPVPLSATDGETAHTADAERRRELAALLPLWPEQLADLSIAGRRHIIKILERALRGERKRGRAGHWTYDVARHAALCRAHRAEAESLKTHLRREAVRGHRL